MNQQPECAVCHGSITEERENACIAVGDSPHCESCGQAWASTLDSQEASHEAYLEARAERVARQQDERDEWRQAQYAKRLRCQAERQTRIDAWKAQQEELFLSSLSPLDRFAYARRGMKGLR